MTRIAVVGNGGSGKTWLALRLGEELRYPPSTDVVVFLDRPGILCLVGVLARRVRHRGRRVEDSGHVDRFDTGFVRYVLTYDVAMRPYLLAELAEAPCRVVHVRSRRQARALCGAGVRDWTDRL